MSYVTISKVSTGEFRDKGSKFFTFLHPIESLDAYKAKLQYYKLLHPKACHVCSAYRLLINGKLNEYSSDDGEPRGSSGLPILNTIKRNHIINVGIYVVRYFGGNKLGIPGLINAYSSSAEDALLNIDKIPWKPSKVVLIEHSYEQVNIIDILVKQFQVKIISQEFGENIETKIRLEEGLVAQFEEYLVEKSSGELYIK